MNNKEKLMDYNNKVAQANTDLKNLLDAIKTLPETDGSGGKYAPRHLRFANYSGTELDEELSNLDTSNITSMYQMFSNCSNLTSLDLSNFDTSNVTNMGYMFRGCTSLTELDLSTWDTSNVTNVSYMFYQCTSLMKIDIRTLDFSNITDYSLMLQDVPSDCEIIVKDDNARKRVLSIAPLLTVKTVAELEG